MRVALEHGFQLYLRTSSNGGSVVLMRVALEHGFQLAGTIVKQ